jgi:hypothetical protein
MPNAVFEDQVEPDGAHNASRVGIIERIDSKDGIIAVEDETDDGSRAVIDLTYLGCD